MYKLIKNKNDWQLEIDNELIIVDELKNVVKAMVQEYDLKFSEIELALLEIEKENTRIAEFGIHGIFMYTLE